MKVVKESYSIDTTEPGFIHVHHVQLLDTGVDMGGPMWFERQNLRWVVDNLRACLTTYAFPETSIQSGDDSLMVNESGPEQAPIINLRNRRPKGTPHAGPYTLAMTKPLAEKFVNELGAVS